MEAKRYVGKVLSDGHLSLPEDMAKEEGKEFEVILLPKENIYSYSERIAKEKEFSMYTEEDIEKVIHESRGIK